MRSRAFAISTMRGVPFQINITLTKQNARQLQEVYELAKSLGAVAVHIFMLVPVGCGETLAETDMLSPSGTSRSCGRFGPWRAGGKFRSK